ncbi:MAG: glutathione S-transferase N-terminal domain-containing protein [Gammaproteobacteria bacterium]|nr:glutathione S-transferase N-terminal domain-containing protein [Gammaproteobacteria bacterium]MCY4340115.1 glutathione S-transferase N-terminal domain-containing protein [Gammaproteobacteria bacterium]
MIDLYYWPTPNGFKISIMLEECGLPYKLVPVNIGAGDQFTPEFLALNPNHRMPVIVDQDAPGGPLSVFESGAILVYLAEKAGRFLPAEGRQRFDALQWLFWQMAGLGPMAGQAGHFRIYQEGKHAYATERYTTEYGRLLAVMERRLRDRDYLAGQYSIADMACYPWVSAHERLGQSLDELPGVAAWIERLKARPAVQRGMEAGAELRSDKPLTEEQRKMLYGQTAKTTLKKD